MSSGGTDLGNPPIGLPNPRHQRALDKLASRIDDPVSKLWFLSNTLARYQKSSTWARSFPLSSDAVLASAALSTLSELCQSPKARHVPLPRRTVAWIHRLRYPLATSAPS